MSFDLATAAIGAILGATVFVFSWINFTSTPYSVQLCCFSDTSKVQNKEITPAKGATKVLAGILNSTNQQGNITSIGASFYPQEIK